MSDAKTDHSDYDHTPLDPDTGFSLNPEFVGEVIDTIAREDLATAKALVAPLPAPDQAELFEQLDPEQRHWLTRAISGTFDSETLVELSPEAAEDVMEALGATQSARALSELDTDDAVHILEEMNLEEQREIIDVLPQEMREEVRESLTYPEESAGRMMRHSLVAVPDSWTVGDTIDYLRAHDDLPSNFYIIYTVDASYHPVGRILLGTLLGNKRDVKLASIMEANTYAVATLTDQEEVAFLFRKYALVEAPVTNEAGRLVGTITVDDVVDVIEEEGEEDYLRTSGVTASDFQSTVRETVYARFGWLFINLLTAVLDVWVIGMFEGSIQKFVALAAVMPMVASMGGNTGTQTGAVAVRALATKNLTASNSGRYVRKEAFVGFLNGLGIGIVMGIGGYFWFHDTWFAIVMVMSATITMTLAGLFGALIPISLHRVGFDPAISSTIFLTTVTDVAGFFSFLGLATLILMHHWI